MQPNRQPRTPRRRSARTGERRAWAVLRRQVERTRAAADVLGLADVCRLPACRRARRCAGPGVGCLARHEGEARRRLAMLAALIDRHAGFQDEIAEAAGREED